MLSTPPTLWIVATPLGNPDDLSPRAKHILENVDLVLAEDTRRAGLMCQRCAITVKGFLSLHDHNEKSRTKSLIQRLQKGEHIALISDAGLPLIADPGFLLVRACREQGIPVSVIPGPCAPVTALAGSGIAPQPFLFVGFLPRSRSDQERLLAPYATLPVTLIFFERKDRLATTWATLYNLLGDRACCIARELTKTHEEYIVGRLQDGAPAELRGELTIIIGPPEDMTPTSEEILLSTIAEEKIRGGTPKDISRRVQARVIGWTNKAIYMMLSASAPEKD